MFERILNFLRRLKFHQKEEWDKIAYSYLKDCNFILDLGCGEGRFLRLCPERMVGIDWNMKSLKECVRKGYNVCRGDVRCLPFKNESVNGIHCSHILEHFLPLDVHKILSEMDRILRPGGILVIRTPLLWNGFYNDLTHVRPYNPEAIIHYLTPSRERTLEHISENYRVILLKFRYKPIQMRNKYLNFIFNVLNRWGFPWLKKTGYMMVMGKEEK